MSKKMHALEDDKWLCNECKHFGGLVFKWGTATTCKGKAIIKLKRNATNLRSAEQTRETHRDKLQGL